MPTARQFARITRWSPRHVPLRAAATSAREFARGYRYAKRLQPARDTASPGGGSAVTNALEEYFDAHAEGPGLWKWRHYFEVYDRHLSRFRGRPVRMVEVGVFGGGSLAMWRDYLGPASTIYGIDIDPACAKHGADGVEIVIGDQSEPAFWRDFTSRVAPVDIVLDDGGHEAHQQIPTLEALLPHLRPGGVYICEDVHGPLHPFHSYIDGLARRLHAVPGPARTAQPNALQQHVASVHRYPILTVIEKPPRPVGAFEAPRRGTDWPVGHGLW